ncbi:MAG: hypothetical protein ACRDDW_02155 [Candidatus Rhabdochlamydia sp.]
MPTIFLNNSCLIVDSLLPKKLQEIDQLSEKEIHTTALFITNVVLKAIKALEERHYKQFDANPGDGGCQMRALELRRLMKMNLKEEYSFLKEKISEIKFKISDINPFKDGRRPTEEAKKSLQKFFRNHFSELRISKEIEYILHCHLSATIRTPYETQENGTIMTRSEISKLSQFSKKIDHLNKEFRKKIVEENQKQLSILSLEAIKASAERIPFMEEKELMLTMLSKEHVHLFTPDEKYEPKAFGCLFYEVKAVLTCLKEERGIVCLKSITKAKKEPFYIFLQSKQPKKEFEVLSEEEYKSLDSNILIIVFEAVMHVEKEMVLKQLECGFSEEVLTQAAHEPPYEPKSSLKDIKNSEAFTEITSYKNKKTKENFLFSIDHVYLNSLGEELKQGKK